MRAVIALVLTALIVPSAAAQEPGGTPQPAPETDPAPAQEAPPAEPPAEPDRELPPIELPPLPVPQVPGEEASAREEMIKLFQQVERRLGEIDDLLFDASAGTPLDAQEGAGIGDLLQRSIDGSEEVRRAMDRILEIAEKEGQSQSSSSSGSSSGESPLDGQPQGQQGSKEQTPEGPSPKPGGEQPKPSGEEPGQDPREQPGEEPDQEPGSEGQPDSPRESLEAPENSAGEDPQSGEVGSASGPQGSERWGDLPTHVRDLFRTEGGGDLPPQYRDWIDAYYRRLNQRP